MLFVHLLLKLFDFVPKLVFKHLDSPFVIILLDLRHLLLNNLVEVSLLSLGTVFVGYLSDSAWRFCPFEQFLGILPVMKIDLLDFQLMLLM